MTTADDAIAVAQSELGKPYSYGADGPGAFDCSGLIQWTFAHVGISLPRTAAAQQAATTPVAGSPRAGDLVFWGQPAHHVGLYIGGGQMIAAPHSGAKVQVQAVYGTPSGYGRVPGLGLASGVVGGVATASNALFGTDGFASGIVEGFRGIAIRLGFVGLGLALVGAGVYYSVSPSAQRAAKEVLS